MLGDGEISLRVVDKTADALVAEVESGGRTQGRPGVHLACERLALHAPTAEDLELAEAVAAAGVDYIALSFVRRASDVEELRGVVGDRARIVAKIETAAALGDLAGITAAADAVMVARGDLGIDCPLEDVPHLQKRIIRHCVEVGTPVITATQMLESMIDAPAPTRAEVSDVANAVFDGTDAVMLSAETAIGHDPALVVATMSRIAARAESEASYRQWANRLGRVQQRQSGDVRERITQSITHAAWQAADDVGAAAILCCTRSGRTARAMARFRPPARLLGLSPGPPHARRPGAVVGRRAGGDGGVRLDRRDGLVRRRARRHRGFIARGDTVVVLAGAPDRLSGAAADVMRIVRRDVHRSIVRVDLVATRSGPAGRRRSIALVHGAMDRSAAMVLLSRRLDERLPRPALRPAGLRPLAPRRRTVHDRRPRRRPRRPARRAAGRRVRAQLRRQRGAGARRAASRAGAGGGRVRGAAVVACLVAGQHRPARRGDATDLRRMPPSSSCAGWSATSSGRRFRSRPARPGGPRAWRSSTRSPTSAAGPPWHAETDRRAGRGDVRLADPRAPPRRLPLPRRAAVRPRRRSPSRAPATTARSPTPSRWPR